MKSERKPVDRPNDPAGQETSGGDGDSTWRKMLWFVLLWSLGVLTITVVGYGLKWLFFSS